MYADSNNNRGLRSFLTQALAHVNIAPRKVQEQDQAVTPTPMTVYAVTDTGTYTRTWGITVYFNPCEHPTSAACSVQETESKHQACTVHTVDQMCGDGVRVRAYCTGGKSTLPSEDARALTQNVKVDQSQTPAVLKKGLT